MYFPFSKLMKRDIEHLIKIYPPSSGHYHSAKGTDIKRFPQRWQNN